MFLDLNDHSTKKRFLEFQASKANDEIDEFRESIKKIACKVKALKELPIESITLGALKKAEIMWATINQACNALTEVEADPDSVTFAKSLKESKLNSLNYKLKKYCHEYERATK